VKASELADTYLSFSDLVVLDAVPNDISVVAGMITEEFQTPLSHVNVLSQQRGTPNMGLRGAAAAFAALDGKWVHLTVGAFEWSVVPVSADEADAWWQAHRPAPSPIADPDYSVEDVLDVDTVGVADVARVGGKAANYGELRRTSGVRVRPALVVPMFRYRQFLVANGFDVEIAAMLADPGFRADGNVRRARLADLQTRMRAAPVDPTFLAAFEARLTHDFPATRVKLRSSTNAEDLARHTGAGLYDSKAAEPGDPTRPVDAALRTVWASTWNFRAFEERSYAGIDHLKVAMAVLVAPSFSDEAANGVAITANLYDFAPGGEDAFYVNAQVGETSVVQPDPAIVADQLVYYFFHSGDPATYYTRSSLLPAGQASVLTRAELFDLGQQLAAIRTHFTPLYDAPAGWARLPMDVEWKLVADADGRHIEVKQARPYPGRGR
jgi:phosphoenolpyruvate synthase/pyruvate phosphate dikinase